MLGCFNQNLGQIWTNPNVALKMQLKKCSVESESSNLGSNLKWHF